MSEFSSMLSSLRPVTANPGEDAAATRAVLRKVDLGQWTREEARDFLEHLGLIEPHAKPLKRLPRGLHGRFARAEPGGQAP